MIGLSYDEVVLVPNYSEIDSRDDISASVDFLGYEFKSAAIPANMICCIDFDKAFELSSNGYFYILHRFMPYEELLNWIRNMQDILPVISISVGVQQKDFDLIAALKNERLRVDFITVDVAHGHHRLVKRMVTWIKNHSAARIIAGNVATEYAVSDLAKWGANAVKVGLSMGKSCTTYNKTGVGSPMFTTVKKCSSVKKEYTHIETIPIIADGQVREIGDVCKGLAAGASMVMIGSEFAKRQDSPAETVKRLEDSLAGIYSYHKQFFGSASSDTKGHNNYVEGKKVDLPMVEQTYLQYLEDINEGVRSCMSYNGNSDIKALKHMPYEARNRR